MGVLPYFVLIFFNYIIKLYEVFIEGMLKISQRRISIEHINSKLKTFGILSERSRNTRKHFGLRMNLIA